MDKTIIKSITKDILELSDDKKKEVHDFISFLKTKQNEKNTEKMNDRKKILMNISVWDEKEISNITDAQNQINKWKIKKY